MKLLCTLRAAAGGPPMILKARAHHRHGNDHSFIRPTRRDRLENHDFNRAGIPLTLVQHYVAYEEILMLGFTETANEDGRVAVGRLFCIGVSGIEWADRCFGSRNRQGKTKIFERRAPKCCRLRSTADDPLGAPPRLVPQASPVPRILAPAVNKAAPAVLARTGVNPTWVRRLVNSGGQNRLTVTAGMIDPTPTIAGKLSR